MSFTREHTAIAEQIKGLLELLPLITKLENDLIDKPRDMAFIADTAFLCRKSEEILQSVRKALNTLSDKVETQGCYVFEIMAERRFSNENATISPNPKPYVKFPSHPDDPGYDEFVKKLPPALVRPHYPSLTEYICSESEVSGVLPFGLKVEDIASIKLQLRVTGKRDL